MKLHNQQIESFDGTALTTYKAGTDGSWFCLSNGLGGSFSAWRHLIDFSANDHRILSWDYRGLYRSAVPERVHDVSIETQAKDLIAVMDSEGVQSAVHMGWSMGVQVVLELYKQAPERVLGMVLIGGASGQPLETVLDGNPVSQYIRPLVDRLHAWEPVIGEYAPRAATYAAALVPIAKFTGLVSRSADNSILRELVSEWMTLDFDCYFETFKALADHNVREILPSIDVPALIIVGDRDLFTPVSVSEEMHRQIPKSELLVVRKGTHYVPLEFSDLLNLRIQKFVRDRLQNSPEGTQRPANPSKE